jgi:hypothetical protein
MGIHYLFVPIELTVIKDEQLENVNFKDLTVYEKFQLCIIEYELILMYGITFVEKNFNF